MCQAMHLFVRACALLLSPTMYFSLAESLYLLWYYETLYIHPPALTSFSLSPRMKSTVLAHFSPLLSFLLFLLLFEPLHLVHKFPPTYSPTLLKSTCFRTNSPPIPPTAPPYPSLVLFYHITHYILLYHMLSIISFFFRINFHISLSHLKLAATHAYTPHQFNMHITFPYFRFYQPVYLPTSFYHYHG